MPKVVGETASGDPIFEIRSVRLVLRDDVAYFNRVVACSKCGRDVPGSAVRNPGDLDQTVYAVICKDCVRESAMASFPSDPLRVDRAVEPPAPAPVDDGRLAALEQRVADLAAQLEARPAPAPDAIEAEAADEAAVVTAGVVASVARLRDVVDVHEADSAAAVARVGAIVEELLGSHAELRGGLADASERIAQLQAGAGADRVSIDLAADGQLGARVDRLVGIVDSLVEAEPGRAAEEVGRLREELGHVPAALEVLRGQLEARIEAVADGVRSSIEAAGAKHVARLEAVEAAVAEAGGEMEELHDLHAALDAGMGQLRSQLAKVSAAAGSVAEVQGRMQDRLEDLAAAQQLAAVEGGGRGRRGARKSGEPASELSALIGDFTREQRRLADQVALLEHATADATAAAARASSQASVVAPLRSDVRALQDRLAAQQDAIAGLRLAVEALRTPAARRKTRITPA